MIWIGTSWKMNKTIGEALEYADALNAVDDWPPTVQPFIIPPHTALAAVRERLSRDSPVLVGAQNAHWAGSGPFTGEISMGMAADAGATVVEIGHSERREHFGETDETVALKVEAAVNAGLTPLVCVGESAAVRGGGNPEVWVIAQIEAALSRVTTEAAASALIAYEPIWAIGESGRPAEPGELGGVIDAIDTRFGAGAASGSARVCGLLYGGSVNRRNAASLLDVHGIDGLFVGRSAWQPADFLALVRIGADATGW